MESKRHRVNSSLIGIIIWTLDRTKAVITPNYIRTQA